LKDSKEQSLLLFTRLFFDRRENAMLAFQEILNIVAKQPFKGNF